jgi:hypothetical protein
MQKNYARDDLALVLVSVDENPQDPEVQAAVREWLKKRNAAASVNLALNEKPELWQAKLRFDGPPAVYVFNREGKWYDFKDKVDVGDIEKRVAELVKAK